MESITWPGVNKDMEHSILVSALGNAIAGTTDGALKPTHPILSLPDDQDKCQECGFDGCLGCSLFRPPDQAQRVVRRRPRNTQRKYAAGGRCPVQALGEMGGQNSGPPQSGEVVAQHLRQRGGGRQSLRPESH